MKIWAISDLHFSHCGKYDMTRYGDDWKHHKEQIIENWRKKISHADIVLIPGDISWEYEMNTAYYDLKTIADLPGKHKIMIKGNHDIWWMERCQLANNLPRTLIALDGNCFETEEYVFCGNMGWTSPNDVTFDALDRNRYDKEYRTKSNALDVARKTGKKIISLLHYPPFTSTGEKNNFYHLLRKYNVHSSVFGHFHNAAEWDLLSLGNIDGTNFQLVTTVFLKHDPVRLV